MLIEKLFYSVIVPAHNAEGTLRKCLSSLQKQSYPRELFEIIVIDDRSSDNTAVIAKEMADLYLRGAFSSVAAVRNRGAAIAQGNVLAFLDADVEADPNWLTVSNIYYSEKRFRGILGFADQPPPEAHWCGKIWNDPRRQRYSLQKSFDFLPSRNLCINAELHKEYHGFDERLFEGGKAGEDKLYCYKFYKAGYPVTCDSSLTMIHLGSESSLLEFLRKEWWRQGNTLALARHFNFDLRLLKNPFISMYHFITGIFFICTVFCFRKRWPQQLSLLAWIAPSSFILLKRTDLSRQGVRIFPGAWLLTWLRWNIAGVALIRQLAGAIFGVNFYKKP